MTEEFRCGFQTREGPICDRDPEWRALLEYGPFRAGIALCGTHLQSMFEFLDVEARVTGEVRSGRYLVWRLKDNQPHSIVTWPPKPLDLAELAGVKTAITCGICGNLVVRKDGRWVHLHELRGVATAKHEAQV